MGNDVKHRTSKGWWIFLLILAVVAAAIFGLWNGTFFGDRLPTFTTDQIQTFTPMVTAEPNESTPAPVSVVGNKPGAVTATVPPKTKPVCGQRNPMFILLLGIDANEQADVIRLARVDFVQKRILILSIPRDFYVPVPGLVEHGITQGKINATYGYGEYFFGLGQGIVEFSKTIFANYGVTFDRYVVFHQSDFSKIIDMVGGVDVHLDQPIGNYGYVGNLHFDGKTALNFAEVREADNDDYRIDRQSVIIKALFSKLTQPENLIKLPGLGLNVIKDKMLISDISLKDVTTFSCLANQLGADSLVMKDIPGNLFKASNLSGQYIRVPSPDATNYIQDLLLNGNY